MPGGAIVKGAPCGHSEIAERYVTSDSGLVFCARCQRGYEAPPALDPIHEDSRFIRERLAHGLL